MTITLYRNETVIFHDRRMVDRYDGWMFHPIVGGGHEHVCEWTGLDGMAQTTLCNRLVHQAGSVQCVVPTGSRLVGLDDGRMVLSCYFDVAGVDAGTVWFVATFGKKTGFKLEDPMPEKQPGLFGDDPVRPGSPQAPPPIGAYGRRPPREDRVRPVVAAIKAHQETIANSVIETHEPVEEWPLGDLPDLRPAAIMASPGKKALVAAIDQAKAKQAAIDGAGADLAGDLDAAIKQILDGSGITAVRILERVRDAIAKGGAP